MRILICEDQDATRHLIQTLVEASGHEVVGVATGLQAVSHREHFDLLLIDLTLSGALDCLATIRRFRMNTSPEDLPIPIFVLNADDPSARQRAKDAGATAFFSKPLSPLEILEAINRVARTST